MNKFDLCIMRRGEKYIDEVLLTGTAEEVTAFASKIANFPSDTIHFAAYGEDGSTLFNTKADGLPNFGEWI